MRSRRLEVDKMKEPEGERGRERRRNKRLGMRKMDHAHCKSKSGSNSKNNNTTKVGYEKAAKRLRTILMRASRLGISKSEVAGLASARKLFPQRDSNLRLVIYFSLVLIGSIIVALICTARKGCTKQEDIVSINLQEYTIFIFLCVRLRYASVRL